MNNVIQLFPSKSKEESVYKPRDYIASYRETYIRGYWGYVRLKCFAFLPTYTEDRGWVWLEKYFKFRSNQGYCKESYRWITHGRACTLSEIKKIEKRSLPNDPNYDPEAKAIVEF